MTGIPIVGFGKVEANLLSAVLDTADVGTLPDLVPLGGTVTFASRVTLMRTDGPVPAAVFPRKMTATIDEEGWLINPVDQTRGIWLPLGLHDVTYNLTPTITVNPHSLEVLPTHTEESPANLLNYMNMGGLPLTVSQFEELSGRIDEISLGGVVSVNGATGDVVLSAASVGALPDTYVPPVQTWGQIPDKPTTFTPTAHVHTIANVTGLQAALDGKQAAGSYAPLSHTHTIANVSGLQAALDGKQVAGSYAASVHTHSIANVSGLQASLDSAAAPQTLTLAGSDLSLSGGGGTVTLPSGGGGSPYPQVAPDVPRIFFPPCSSTSTTGVNQNVYLTALSIPFGSIVEIGIEVTTAQVGGELRLGLYAPEDNGFFPKSRLVDAGIVDISTTGWKTITLPTPIAWTGGTIFGAVYRPSTSASPQVRSAVNGSQSRSVGVQGAWTGSISYGGFYMTGNHDVGLPVTFNSSNQGYQPMLFGIRIQ